MKTVIKNVLLGSVAGLAMVGTAAAADLPVKAKAAEYVKICSTYGAGFYYIPGTDTCLKLGGYVQNDYYYQDFDNVPSYDYADTYFRLRGAIRLDARTQTEYGTLRSFMEWRLQYGNSSDIPGSDGTSPNLKSAYIQFAGFTFGKVQSFFDYYADNNVWGIDSVALTADYDANVAAYTADFGNGFTATISIEDDTVRATGVDDFPNFNTNSDIPALVGNLNYEGEWGGFQVSGVIRQVTTDYADPGITGFSDEVAWAVLGGVKFNLPTLGEGDTLYIEATYADGSMNYTGINGNGSPLYTVQDIYYTGAGWETATAWTVAAELTHYFTPNVFGVVFGNYGEADIPDGAYVPSLDIFTVGGSLNWSPVKGLLFVAQYTYGETNYDAPVDNGFGSLVNSSNFNQVILSVRRTF